MNFEIFEKAALSLPREFIAPDAICGLVLGSGWSRVFASQADSLRLPYNEIPGLGASTVQGHVGELMLVKMHGRNVVVFAGRRHYYEGCGWEPVMMPIELMRRMGVKRVLLTNAAGGISSRLSPGCLLVIRDHLNLTGLNPLQGVHREEWGTRFPDMSNLYDDELSQILYAAGTNGAGITHKSDLHEGVYAFSPGPSYETPAEIKAYKLFGADACGMSTVPEAIFAHACGMKVAALSCITNMAAGLSSPLLQHEDVLEQSELTRPRMSAVIDEFIAELCGNFN